MPSPASFCTFIKTEYQRKLIDFLSSDISSSSEEYMDFQRKYVQCLPSFVVDGYMNDLLLHLSERKKRHLMLRTIDLMFSERTKRFCFYPFDYTHERNKKCYFIKKVIKLIKIKKPNLMYLELNCAYLNYSKTKEILKFLPSLKSLTIKYHRFRNDFIEVILKFCPQLEELEWKVYYLSLSDFHFIWPKHESLRIVRIYGYLYDDPDDDYSLDTDPNIRNESFDKLTNLEIFQTNSNCFNLIFSKRFPTNFKKYYFSNDRSEAYDKTTLTTVKNVYQIFPQTNSISLFNPEDEVLAFIPNFLHLKHLLLFNWENTPESFMNILEKCGSQLEFLLYDGSLPDLSGVLRLCPNLEYFDFTLAKQIKVTEVVTHSKLRHILLLNDAPVYLTKVLKGLNSLEVVHINELPRYSPKYLEKLISGFKTIKILHIYDVCELTQNCIEQIIRRCHNLQELLLPSNNSKFNIDDVDIFIKNNNYSLKLIKSEAYKSIHKYDPYSTVLFY